VQSILAVTVIVSILIMTTALVITEYNIALTDTSLSNHHQIFSKQALGSALDNGHFWE
jgi:hypothetical protein